MTQKSFLEQFFALVFLVFGLSKGEGYVIVDRR